MEEGVKDTLLLTCHQRPDSCCKVGVVRPAATSLDHCSSLNRGRLPPPAAVLFHPMMMARRSRPDVFAIAVCQIAVSKISTSPGDPVKHTWLAMHSCGSAASSVIDERNPVRYVSQGPYCKRWLWGTTAVGPPLDPTSERRTKALMFLALGKGHASG
jgi:hypothetical protein